MIAIQFMILIIYKIDMYYEFIAVPTLPYPNVFGMILMCRLEAK